MLKLYSYLNVGCRNILEYTKIQSKHRQPLNSNINIDNKQQIKTTKKKKKYGLNLNYHSQMIILTSLFLHSTSSTPPSLLLLLFSLDQIWV